MHFKLEEIFIPSLNYKKPKINLYKASFLL